MAVARFKPTGPLDPRPTSPTTSRKRRRSAPRQNGKHRSERRLYLPRARPAAADGEGQLFQEATTILRAHNPAAPDFVATPDDVFSAPWCLAIAAAEWASKGCNALADEDDIRKVTKAINGGFIGLSDRTEQLRLTKVVWF